MQCHVWRQCVADALLFVDQAGARSSWCLWVLSCWSLRCHHKPVSRGLRERRGAANNLCESIGNSNPAEGPLSPPNALSAHMLVLLKSSIDIDDARSRIDIAGSKMGAINLTCPPLDQLHAVCLAIFVYL